MLQVRYFLIGIRRPIHRLPAQRQRGETVQSIQAGLSNGHGRVSVTFTIPTGRSGSARVRQQGNFNLGKELGHTNSRAVDYRNSISTNWKRQRNTRAATQKTRE